MQGFICTACGTQYPPSTAPPSQCTICEDERQFIPPRGPDLDHAAGPGGQPFQRLAPARAGHHRHRHAAAIRHRPARAAHHDAQRQRAVGLHLDARRRHRHPDQRARRAEGDRHLASALLHDDGGMEPRLRRRAGACACRRPALDHASRSLREVLGGRDAEPAAGRDADPRRGTFSRRRHAALGQGRRRPRRAVRLRHRHRDDGPEVLHLHAQLPEPDPAVGASR